MSIRTSSEAVRVASEQTRNRVGACQMYVHEWFDAPSVGDVDHDGDADAVDGWESEPRKYRITGTRNPDVFGVPIAFGGGSNGYGHRALLMKPGHIRSTDMSNNHYAAGITSTVTAPTTSEAIAVIERSMGVHYLGASKTISGALIPNFRQITPKPPAPQTRGLRIDRSLRKLRKAQADAKAKKKFVRARLIGAAIKSLLSIPTHDKKR